MSNKKKVLLFLGAVMLIAFGNYTQFMKNNKGKTAVEGKNSEKATSSFGNNAKKKENPKNQKQDAKPEQKQKDAGKLKIETNKNVENQYKLNSPKSEKKKSATEDKSSESTSSSNETN